MCGCTLPWSVYLNLKHGRSGDSGVLVHLVGRTMLSAVLAVTKLLTEATQGRKARTLRGRGCSQSIRQLITSHYEVQEDEGSFQLILSFPFSLGPQSLGWWHPHS